MWRAVALCVSLSMLIAPLHATDNTGVLRSPFVTVMAPSLDDVLKLKSPATDDGANLRKQMIAQDGRTVGFRAGLANRSVDLQHMLEIRAGVLDKLFQFQTLLGPGGVLPPVIVEARDVTAYDVDQMRSSTKVYKILRGERLVSVPPTWRDYLYTGLVLKAADFDLPQEEARPKNTDEIKVWEKSVREGWAQGQQEAHAIFEANLNRLTRDFNGMLRYSILLQQGIISPTQIAESHRAVSGSTLEIKLDDRLRRITQRAELKINPEQWHVNTAKLLLGDGKSGTAAKKVHGMKKEEARP